MNRALSAFSLFIGLSLALVASTGAVAATSDAAAQMSVADWLAKAAHMVRTGSYRGVMVYLRNDDLDTLRIIHRYHDGVEQERLLAMTGRPREIIRTGNRVVSILPANKVVLITHQKTRGGRLLSRVSEFASDRMRAHYHMKIVGSKRLADRPTNIIRISPRDEYRYGYRILIDSKTYLPLKLNLLYDNKVLEQMMFTEIAYPKEIDDSVFKPTYDIGKYRVINHKSMQTSDAPITQVRWRSNKLPPGFHMVETGMRTIANGQPVRQLLFTDGVATVSAFISSADVPDPLIGGTTMGSVNAFGRKADKYHITAVGEVPAATVRMIAEHLVHVNGTTADARDK